jgi:galactoside O-acetyltransferase
VIGALALVKRDCEEFGVYVGCPARKVKERKRNLLSLAEELLGNDEREG